MATVDITRLSPQERLATLDEDIKAGSTWEGIEAELDRRYS
jgi:hypothetical protein